MSTHACASRSVRYLEKASTAVILLWILYLLETVRPVVGDLPHVRVDSGLIAGTRVQVAEKEVEAFLGIPYAVPPIGELRFKKPQPTLPWNGTYNASSKPSPCWQLDLHFIENGALNYSSASEDCLYLNIWRPMSPCLKTNSCDKKLPVVVFIHGGAFQWGDSSLFLYDPANFVAMSDVVFVTFNYRLSILGFLSLEIPALPGNMGLWDQNLVLKWVQKNIANFGGDPNEVTLSGQSAGAISVGLHAISPHSQGLFKRAILQSGTQLSTVFGVSNRGTAKNTAITAALGCFENGKTMKEQLNQVANCLTKLEPKFIFDTLKSQDMIQQLFMPVDGDDFLPDDLLSNKKWNGLFFKEILIGSFANEGTLFINHLNYRLPSLFKLFTGDYRIASIVALGHIFDISLALRKRIVQAYFGDEGRHELKEVAVILSKMFGDAIFYCPTQIFADATAKLGITTYRYLFDYRPSYSFWPEWTGASHGDELLFTLGSLPFLKDESRYTEPMGETARAFFSQLNFTTEEETFMKQLVSTWNSFVQTGKPTIPVSGVEWPRYTGKNPQLLRLHPTNYKLGLDEKRDLCKLWEPLLLKQ
ncbi:acetylcholinesterase-like [Ixodes scapularis]|uniref:acetylcholinesterase-like n=1 Tax=Ixodes scapularis TaxID=6945 RepID=UPI001C385C87|nr:acetylcholinesterase-like [Ixodes scapularis]